MDTPVFHSEPHFDKSHGIFADEDLTEGELTIIHEMVKDLRAKIHGIRGVLAELRKIDGSISDAAIRELKEKNNLPHLSIKTSIFKDTSSKLLQDIQLFLGHDWSQLAAFTKSYEFDNDEERYTYYLQSLTAVLICFENALALITGEQQHETIYEAESALAWFKNILESRFFIAGSKLSDEGMNNHLKRNGLLDKDGISVYKPYRIHIHTSSDLELIGSAGACLLMGMYNWAKNSITVGEMRGRLYFDYVKDPLADAYAALLQKRIQENNGHIDVHMEIFETTEAYIGCVSDTGAGFDLNALKQALFELTKDEEQMSRLLRLGIISEEMVHNLKEWETDPRAYCRIISDLPSLVKLPRFSSANNKKLELVGMHHSGIGLFGIEVSARQHFATTFITEQHDGGACMIQVIPKNPEKYKKLLENPDHTRKRVADLLFQTPPHLKKVA